MHPAEQGPTAQPEPDPTPQPGTGQAPLTDSKRKNAEGIASGLIGSIYADSSLDATTQKSKVDQVVTLRSIALSSTETADTADATSPTLSPALALNELDGMNRAVEIQSLDKAATALAGITALVAGLFTGIGFTTGDFVHMISGLPRPGKLHF